MSKSKLPARRFPLLVKVFSLPIWGAMVVLTLGIYFALLNAVSLAADGYQPAQILSTIQPAYNLFAVLPKKGEVLGQKVDYSDLRVAKLNDFLRFYRSPMINEAAVFVEVADKYNLPWTLLPAIACKESGCGRVIPVDSYNAFGWAVYTGQKSGMSFDSWAQAIEVVGQGLRERYFDTGLDTVEAIETRYTPSSANSHNHWQMDVEYFMDELESWQIGAK